MSVRFNDNIKFSTPKPSDDRYYQRDNGLTPWSSIAEVNTNIPTHHRFIGLTVNVLGQEYWYSQGIDDNDLVLKTFGSAIIVDDEFISGSTNPVESRVIQQGLETNVANSINNADAEQIQDSDKIGFFSIIENALRHITWANIKSTLKSYFDDLYVKLLVAFGSTINTETFDVVASMHNQFIDVDYPTEVTATILETGGLPVGGITTFEQMGAGNILFVVENSSTMTIQKDKNKTSSDSDVVQLMRKEDVSGVQQYRVIGGVE